MKTNIGSLLAVRAANNPDREAYVDSTSPVRLTFAELNARANQMAAALREAGVAPGDRVAIMMMNSAEFFESYFAIAKLGGVVVPLNWRLVADELEFILNDSGAETLVFGNEFLELATDLHGRGGKTKVKRWWHSAPGATPAPFAKDYEALRQAASPGEPDITAGDEDLLYIMYTSGTTGLPKGVMHSHATTFWALLTINASVDLHDGDRYLTALPMFHVGALTPVTLSVYVGTTSIVMREFDPKRAWELMKEEKVTSALLVPAMLNFMVQVPDVEKYDHSHLRWIQTGAAPVPVSLIQRYAELGIEVHQLYGLTESCGPACFINADNALKKIGSTGLAFFHTEVRLVDQDGEDCKPGEQGEVWVRGNHNMLGYWNNKKATSETITQDGWLRTGDVAITDEDGYFYIQDRIKDMIISGGENVYPAEIENVILTHPLVTEVAVIGQPSDKWGESPFAVVVRKDGSLDAAQVLQHCDGKLARFKLPTGAAFIDVIPRNANGKVLKRVLREQFPGPAPV